MMRTYRVTLADERYYSIDVQALSFDDAIEMAQEIAETNEDDPRFQDLAGSFHDVVSCVEVCS